MIKGQLISKRLYGIFNSPKKRTKKFDFTTMVPQVELFSFVFWENWRHQKEISKLIDLYQSIEIGDVAQPDILVSLTPAYTLALLLYYVPKPPPCFSWRPCCMLKLHFFLKGRDITKSDKIRILLWDHYYDFYMKNSQDSKKEKDTAIFAFSGK